MKVTEEKASHVLSIYAPSHRRAPGFNEVSYFFPQIIPLLQNFTRHSKASTKIRTKINSSTGNALACSYNQWTALSTLAEIILCYVASNHLPMLMCYDFNLRTHVPASDLNPSRKDESWFLIWLKQLLWYLASYTQWIATIWFTMKLHLPYFSLEWNGIGFRTTHIIQDAYQSCNINKVLVKNLFLSIKAKICSLFIWLFWYSYLALTFKGVLERVSWVILCF